MYPTSLRCLARAPARYGARRSFSRAAVPHAALITPARQRPLPLHGTHLSATSTTAPLSSIVSPAYAVQARRHYTVGGDGPPRSVAVLGGGLTGLTTAWYLMHGLPDDVKITVYEASNHLGGWIDTEKVKVRTPDGQEGFVHFERAARMIKPQVKSSPPKWDDLVFFDLVSSLGLEDELMCQKRGEETVSGYIYYPDHLVGIPSLRISPFRHPIASLKALGGLFQTLTEPVFRELIPSMFGALRSRHNEYAADMFKGTRDMSIGDYYAYRFGSPELVDKVVSAMIHGITGGDVWKTSMVSGPFSDMLIPPDDDQPITDVRVRRADYEFMEDLLVNDDVFALAAKHLDSTALWFRNGFRTLTDAIVKDLKESKNVTIKTGDPVMSVRYNGPSDRVIVTTKRDPQPTPYEKVISTVYAKTLDTLTGNHLPSLASSTAVTIQLVNLWYPVPFANFPHNGFGYLLPQALAHDQNPECVLGVIFDSDREFTLPVASSETINRGADTIHGTKLTVMLGGHYWDELPPSFLPSQEEAVELAKTAVARHLNLPLELTQHVVASTKLCRDCIPQPLVGHAGRMRAAHGEIEWGFKGRLAVAGQSYQKPGVLSMLRAALDIARHVADPQAESCWSVGETGLERFTRQPEYMTVEKAMLPLRFNSEAWVDEQGKVQPGSTRKKE
ncbi:hypothetical protein VTI74DRAFT_11662 [Chaetomium olivicolor]